MRKLLGMVAGALLAMSGTAHAVPMLDFEIDGSASSVAVTSLTSSGFGCCTLGASLNSGLDGTSFSLAEGQSSSFDFIDWNPGGFIGGADFEVSATLAFSSPTTSSVTSSGGGSFATFVGLISRGVLTWDNQPQTVTLADGSMFDVAFEGGAGFFLGDATTGASVTATNVVAPVPLPAALPLLAFALGGFVLVGRRRRMMA